MSGFNEISNNSGPGSSAEPSMEEILASIRRILKEDETGRAAPPKVDIEDDVLVLDATMVAKAPDLSSAAAMSPTALPAENDLAAAHPEAPVTSYHNEMHIVSEPAPLDFDPGAPAPEALYETLPVMPEPETIPDWPEPAPEPAPEPELAAASHGAPAAFAAIMPEPPSPPAEPPPPEAVAPAPEPPPEPQQEQSAGPPHEAAPEPTMSDSYEPPEPMVSDDATRAAKQSIGALVRSISMEKAVAVSRGGTTIEDIVREEIRPMLKSWLDSHLPVLVERIVRAEIERVVDRTQL